MLLEKTWGGYLWASSSRREGGDRVAEAAERRKRRGEGKCEGSRARAAMAQEARLKIEIGRLLGCRAVMCMRTGYANR